MNKSGVLITFEGIDGSGKSTQARLLCGLLDQFSLPHEFIREPGGTSISEKIRRLLLDRSTDGICYRTEVLLYLAARAELTDKVIAPALNSGRIVIADRFYDSTYAYQIFGRQLPDRIVRSANMFATSGIRPSLTFLVDVPVATAQRRLKRQKDRLESAGGSFQNRVRKGFLALARSDPQRIKTLDGRRPADEIFDKVTGYVVKLLKRRRFLGSTRES
jgi:dTMP kinase